MILAQRPGVSRESMGERGSNSFFAQNLISIFYFPDNAIVTFFLNVAGLSDSQLSIDRGIGV